MKKLFVPYELAVKLKALGFDEQCFGYYLCENSAFGVRLEITTNWIDLLPYDSSSCKAPLYQQAFRWFREKHNLFGCIDLHVSNPKHWYIRIDDIINNDYVYHSEDTLQEFYTYEEAELACLKKLIEVAKDIKKNDDSTYNETFGGDNE